MQLVLFDDRASRQALLPFTHTRPLADIRCGILTARQRWERLLNLGDSSTVTEAYLQTVFPAPYGTGDFVLVHGGVIATPELAAAVGTLHTGEALTSKGQIIAARVSGAAPAYGDWDQSEFSAKEWTGDIGIIRHPWDIFAGNEAAIHLDFTLITEGRVSAALPGDVMVRGDRIFVEEGAAVGAGVVINAVTGPVYIGRNTEIMEGCAIRGPFALCDMATLKMGAKIYGCTTIGPNCKVGGEVSQAVFFGNSNKGHDGYIGHAVIGEWCNLGADTNCSDLKNNYDGVKVWDEAAGKSIKTGLTFCGLLMGDHSKCGINTMFNTGTIAGVSCNIWGGGFPEKFVPSFSWGGPDGMTTYQFDRAMETAERVMSRRGKALGEGDRAMLKHVFETTAAARSLVFPN